MVRDDKFKLCVRIIILLVDCLNYIYDFYILIYSCGLGMICITYQL